MAVEGDTRTLSTSDESESPESLCVRPYLFLVLEAHRPAAPPLRFSLAALDELTVGRGERGVEPSRRRLHARVTDPWMSSAHARFTRVARRWVVEDTASKNGIRVNGDVQARAELEDGDVVEIGHTYFLFREAIPGEPGEAPVGDVAAAASPALATLSPSLSGAFTRLALVARSTVSVLIEGETGTGKEVVARALHALSARPGELGAVNCGALPANLVEGELFGHRKGAFSGAVEDRPGLVRSADGGTLFLDEIGDLPAAPQAALLRALQEGEVRPVGATRPITVDLRVVAATHRPVDAQVASGAFRADLFARLAGHRVTLPPLRERREDLGLLIGAVLARIGGGAVTLHPRAARALFAYAWPGNVRELEKALGAAVVLAEGGVVERRHLPEAVQRVADGPDSAVSSEDAARRERLTELMREHRGNVAAVARAMGKARMQVQRWLKRYRIDAEQYRRSS